MLTSLHLCTCILLKYTPMKISDDSWKPEGWYISKLSRYYNVCVTVLVCLKLQLFVQLHGELELYYTQLLDDVVKTCLSAIKYPGAASSSIQVKIDVYQATCWTSWVQKIHFSVWNFFYFYKLKLFKGIYLHIAINNPSKKLFSSKT